MICECSQKILHNMVRYNYLYLYKQVNIISTGAQIQITLGAKETK